MPERLVQTLSELIRIESVNPAYPGGSRGEGEIAAFVEARCRQLGLEVARQPVLPGRENVLATLLVPGARQSVLFEAHLDTVALEPMGSRALEPELRNGNLYGRGACDTKGSLAAMLGALELLIERRTELGVNVHLLASVDEEHRYRGILAFLESGIPVHAAIVGEPTNLEVVIATKGCVRFSISVLGRAAHSSKPDQGVNAIDHLADVLIALRAYQADLAKRWHPRVGQPTLSVGRVWGGVGVNIVPDRCTIEIDRRIIPGEDPMGVLAEIDAVLARARAGSPELRLEREAPFLTDWALDTPADSPLVAAAQQAARKIGRPDRPVGVPYGTDASKLWALGRVPSIVFGPGSIEQAHTANEFVPVDQLLMARNFLLECVRGYSAHCGS